MITKPEGYTGYVVKDGEGGLPIGDIIEDRQGWVFWPAPYRKPITLRIAGEILSILQELNGKKQSDFATDTGGQVQTKAF